MTRVLIPVLRSEEVLNRIHEIKSDLMDRSLELGRLLKEARDESHYLDWGYSKFGEWVNNSGLDLSERSAWYLISVVEFQERHQITDEQLKVIGISKAKEIASLPAGTDESTVRGLLEQAETAPISTVKEVVGVLKNSEWVYKTLKMPRAFYEGQWIEGLEKARRLYGNTFGPDGEAKDIEDWRAIEIAFAEFLNYPAPEDSEDEYERLCRQVFDRDDWKCRRCGSREALHAHHIWFRSQGGPDEFWNLITLCLGCHEAIHRHDVIIVQDLDYVTDGRINANKPVQFEEFDLAA